MTAKKKMGNDSIERWLQLDKMQLVSMFGSHQMKLKHTGPKAIGHGARLFLSYAHQDHIVVKRLYSKLVESGFRPWMDHQELRAGENWRVAIENAIQESDFFVLCLSPNSVGRRGFLQREIRAAMDRLLEFLERDIYFVRNGLLHQAQTKGGWIISATATEIWDANGKTINAIGFSRLS